VAAGDLGGLHICLHPHMHAGSLPGGTDTLLILQPPCMRSFSRRSSSKH
jgi:hypothetical protein